MRVVGESNSHLVLELASWINSFVNLRRSFGCRAGLSTGRAEAGEGGASASTSRWGTSVALWRCG